MEMKLIYIEWEDASSQSGWHTKQELEEWAKSTCIISQVGWVYRETKRNLILVSRLDKELNSESYGNLQNIPKTWIIKRVNLSKHIK